MSSSNTNQLPENGADNAATQEGVLAGQDALDARLAEHAATKAKETADTKAIDSGRLGLKGTVSKVSGLLVFARLQRRDKGAE